MSLARNSIPLTALHDSATGGTGARAFYSGDHSAPQHAGRVPRGESGVLPPNSILNADQTLGAPVSRADDVTIFGDHIRQPWPFLPVRQPDGTIKHIPLTTARVP